MPKVGKHFFRISLQNFRFLLALIVYFLDGHQSLCLLLSFAVGSLIGDVFLHLLPTVWADTQGYFYFCSLRQ